MIASFTRLKKAREAMQRSAVDLYILQSTDPHQSEYLPAHWRFVEWLTGFRGEVAVVVITAQEALLWTDSCFFLSGADQLKGSPFRLMRMGIDTPVDVWVAGWRASRGEDPAVVGAQRRAFFLDVPVDVDADLVGPLWRQRPPLPSAPVWRYPEQYDGEATADRIARVLDAVEADGAHALWLSALDDIAWTLSLRGSDIECTPVFISYLYLAREGSLLFIDPAKVPDDVRAHLADLGVGLRPYDEAQAFVDAHRQPDWATANPVPLLKAVKGPVELDGFRAAMVRDGVVLTQFFHWLEATLSAEGELTVLPDGTIGISNEITECDCARRLIELRSAHELYLSESFLAIVAWGAHAAMPHYEPRPESDVPIQGDGLLLIDTGAHYLDGTTDITRTIGIGRVSDAQRHDYTLVLKGHIRLATAVFPVGTRGDQLDALARIDLWREGKTYRHGTSHGVGHCLSVHEGPMSIRMEHNPQPLLPGMVLSNEPALYRSGRYGIRHECLLTVVPFAAEADAAGIASGAQSTPAPADEMGAFLQFETLSLCYIDTACVDLSLLTPFELEWLNDYNRRVYETLAPHLDASDADWLRAKTAPLA